MNIKINNRKFITIFAVISLLLAVLTLHFFNKRSKVDEDWLFDTKNNVFYGMVRNQYESMMWPINSFTQVGFDMPADKIMDKVYKECSPLLFKVLTFDSFNSRYRGQLKQPHSPLYLPTYDCINKQIEPTPVSEKQFIKFVNAPRFEQYKNVPDVKKVIEIANQDNTLTIGEAVRIIKAIDQSEKQIAMDKFKNS